MVEKIQVKLGVVGHKQRPLTALQQAAEVLRRLLLVYALRRELLVGDARQVHDEGGQADPLRQADQRVQAARLRPGLQLDSPQLNNPVSSKLDTGGLRVKDHNAVKPLPKLLHQAAHSSSGQLSPVE